MNYQGHISDGSSIQRHSASDAYPYVLQLRDRPQGGYYWEIIGPGIPGAIRTNSPDDWDAIVRHLKSVASSEDAWAFELERLCLFAGQKLHGMIHAARGFIDAVPGRVPLWTEMTKDGRVGVLLAFGRMRSQMNLPPLASHPVFVTAARALVD